jgi:membrane protease YdiL (CAAX protease family)
VSYPVLIVAMALAPAVAEELVFRGVLGRRLTAQWGLARGVLASSVCFALVHGSPPHAIATFPVAVLLHLLYLQTGTIWTPILVHFGNNLLAISMVRFDLASHAPVSPIVALGMCGYLAAILVLLKARTGNVTLASVRFARN